MTEKPRIKPLKWTVPGYLYAKSVALVVGKRGGGKSLFMSWFTGMVTQGRYIDQSGHEKSMDPMNVWINVQAEDPIEEFWNPRLKLAGADFDRVRVTSKSYLFPDSNGTFREDLLQLHREGFSPDIVIFESMNTHLRNPYFGFERNRKAMAALVNVAQTNNLTVIFAHHLRKGRGSTVESAIGGQGYLQAATKGIYIIGAFPNANSGTQALACERINGATPTSLMFELKTKYVREAKAPHPYLRYVGPIDVEAKDVYDAGRSESKGTGMTGVEVAAEFIRQHWEAKGVPVMRLVDLEEAARAAEVWFSKGSFERARAMAGLQNIRDARARELLGAEYDFVNADGDGRTAWVKLPKAASGEEVLPNDPVGKTLRLVPQKED